MMALALAVAAPLRAQNPGSADATWQDTSYVDAIIRLAIEGGPSQVVPALSYNAKLLLPLRQVLHLAEVRVEAMALRDSASAILQPGNVRLLFRPAAHLLMRGTDTVAYDPHDVTWWDGDLFVETTLFDKLLGVATSVEWEGLAATMGHSGGLPVVARERREQRRQMMGVRRPAPEVLDVALQNHAVDGAVASWTLTAARRGPSEQLSLDLGLGAEVLGGSAELRPLFYTTDGFSGADVRASWFKAWGDEDRLVRQVRLGDLQSSGRRSRLLQGVSITNAPFIRSSEFDVEHLVNNVPAGWEAELYEGGQLLAYSDPDAVGAFRVPLQLGYGQNPFEVVYYGPGGETIRRTRTIRVPFSRLPSGHLEYALAAGRCRLDPCDAVVSADARYGVTSRLTVQGGWDAIAFGHDSILGGGTLWQPYALISGAPLPALALTGEAVVNDHMRASANFEPTQDLRATAEFTRFEPSGARAGGTLNLSEASRSEGSLFWRPGWIRGSLIFQGAGVFSSGPTMDRRLQRLSASARFGRFRYGLGVLHDELMLNGAGTPHFAIDASADAALAGPWSWLRSSTVQGQLAFEPSNGLTALRGSLGRRIGQLLRLDAGIGWLRGTGMSLELAFNTAVPGPRVGARTRVTNLGSEALVYSSGSVAYDPRTQLLQMSDFSDLGRGGISGVLFQDDNANGKQDPGEAGLAGIPVIVGGFNARTDARGRFAAFGMYPSEPLQIDVDTLSFENPRLVMPAAALRVHPAPNAWGDIRVPVVVGAEVSGYVVLGDEAVAGVPVILRELNTGAEVRVTTFRDGGFYKGAVPPGEYEVVLPDTVLEQLHASAPPLSIFVPPGKGDKRFEDLALRLEPLP